MIVSTDTTAAVATGLAARHRKITVLRQGNWSRLLRWLGQHPANGGTILAVACSKLAGHRGPVD